MSDWCNDCGGRPPKRGCVTCGMRPVAVSKPAQGLPPLPSLRALAAELREINRAFSHPDGGPEFVYLFAVASDFPQPAHWRVGVDPNTYLTLAYAQHREWVPGDCGEIVAEIRPDGTVVVDDGSKFDAVAAARRLLAAARDAGPAISKRA